MTGVEILAMEEVATAFEFGWFGFWIIFGFCSIVGAIWSIINTLTGEYEWVIIPFTIVIAMLMGVVFGGLLGMQTNGEPTAYETQYKVTVSDEVPMNEFLKRYEIIDQEGKVYTIRERDDYVEPETEESTEKTGYWTGWENAECSECGQFNVMVYSGKHLNYCPDCGIKMEPKENVER